MKLSDPSNDNPSREGVGHALEERDAVERPHARTAPAVQTPPPPAAAPGTPRRGPGTGDRLRSLGSSYALIGVWLGMAVLYGVLMPDKFLRVATLQAIFGSQSPLLFLAVASLCTFLVGEFDLSFASIMGLAATIVTVLVGLHHVSVPVACLLAMLASLACGAFNAFFVVRLKVPSLVITLGTASLFLGLGELLSSSNTVSINEPAFSRLALTNVLGLPLSFYYGLILCAALAYLLTWTPMGRHIIFVGANREVARLAGINVDRIRAASYVGAGLFAGLAGILLTATVGGFDSTASSTFLLPALAAVFLGTAVVLPGQFNPMGTFIGIYFLATGILGLQLLGYSDWVQDAFYGIGLVAAVTVATLVRGRSRTT